MDKQQSGVGDFPSIQALVIRLSTLTPKGNLLQVNQGRMTSNALYL